MRRCFSVVAVLGVVSGCGTGRGEDGEDKVALVADDDPRMNAAIENARASVARFIAALESPTPKQSSFAIKLAFRDGENVEHLWVSRLSYDGAQFRGTVDNAPQMVATVEMGQEVTIAPSEISDWMFVDDGKLIGGETLRVLRDGLSPSERAEFDRSIPFAVE